MAHGPDTDELLQKIAEYNSLSMKLQRFFFLKRNILELYHLRIHSLPKLPAGLRELDCSRTELTSLPELPAGLKWLYCDNTPITSLPELPAGLQGLFCNNTPLTSLPKLPVRLLELHCNNTPLTSLPELPIRLHTLGYYNTPLILQHKEGESFADYKLRWKLWREEQATKQRIQESKRRIQERTRIWKEEIMMAAWHPKRIAKLLDLGIELEDM